MYDPTTTAPLSSSPPDLPRADDDGGDASSPSFVTSTTRCWRPPRLLPPLRRRPPAAPRRRPGRSAGPPSPCKLDNFMCRLVDPSEGSTKTHLCVNFTLKFLGSTLPTSPTTIDPSPLLPRCHAKRKEGIKMPLLHRAPTCHRSRAATIAAGMAAVTASTAAACPILLIVACVETNLMLSPH